MKELFLASTNSAKLKATQIVFNDYKITPVSVDMEIKQPLSEEETLDCAKKRAQALPNGYRLGLEAGVTIINNQCFLVNYGVLLDDKDNEYYAGGSYVPLPEVIKVELYNNHLELKEAMNKHFKAVNENGGTIEILTNGLVTRVDIFTHICKILKGELEKCQKE